MSDATTTARRARIAVRHHLHPEHRAADVQAATTGMVALHATDPASVYLGLLARTRALTVDDVDRALYDDRSLVRVMAMRRTIFATTATEAVVPFAACTLRVAATERARLVKGLAVGSAVSDPEAWLDEVLVETAAALAELGEPTAQELTAAVPLLQTRWNPSPGTRYGGETPVTSRILSQLSMEGVIERGRPTGASFTSTRYRWRIVDPPIASAAIELGEAEGRRQLVARWLERFGPATEADLVWWTGLTKTHVRQAVAAIDVETVDLDGTPGLALAGDEADDDAPGPWVALLPGLDPTAMGWRERDWYLDPELVPELFDRSGNAGPSIWADGRVVGGWAQRSDGTIATELLVDVSDEHHDLLEIERRRVVEFLGDVRVTPRFRSPLERRLSEPGAP